MFFFVQLRNNIPRLELNSIVLFFASYLFFYFSGGACTFLESGTADQARALRLAPANARLGRTAMPRLVLLWIIFFVHWGEEGKKRPVVCMIPG